MLLLLLLLLLNADLVLERWYKYIQKTIQLWIILIRTVRMKRHKWNNMKTNIWKYSNRYLLYTDEFIHRSMGTCIVINVSETPSSEEKVTASLAFVLRNKSIWTQPKYRIDYDAVCIGMGENIRFQSTDPTSYNLTCIDSSTTPSRKLLTVLYASTMFQTVPFPLSLRWSSTTAGNKDFHWSKAYRIVRSVTTPPSKACNASDFK